MKLRKLSLKDQDDILEWMKDPDINCFFRFDSESINQDTVVHFIKESHSNQENMHYAIANDEDEYLGTISLKNIDYKNGNAEYAVSLRQKAIGQGIASKATDTLLYIAFFELKLHKVYLNVVDNNARAIHFYEKYGFNFEGEFVEHLNIRSEYRNLRWYGILKDNFIKKCDEQIKDINILQSQYEKNMFRVCSK